MIDVNFDFTSDTPGCWDGCWERMNGLGGCGKKDPDSCSPTQLDYSRQLWSRVLPNGERMEDGNEVQEYRPSGDHDAKSAGLPAFLYRCARNGTGLRLNFCLPQEIRHTEVWICA